MNVYRCLICGDSFIGSKKPSNCPFCGAHEDYMVIFKEWDDLNVGLEISVVTRKNVIKALEIELSNAAFYLAAAKKAEEQKDGDNRSIFKALAKVEAEHASIFKKILKGDFPVFKIEENAFNRVVDNFKESLKRETKAVKFYQAAHDQAIEDRAKQIFKALVEVESDHIALDKEHLCNLKICLCE